MADPGPGDAPGAAAGHPCGVHFEYRPQPGVLCRAFGPRHAGTRLRPGNASVPDDRDGLRNRLWQGRGGGNERAGHLHHADLRLPGADRGERKIRDHHEPRLSPDRSRAQEGQDSVVLRGRPALLDPDRSAGGGAVLHLAGALLHGAQRPGLFAHELEALDRGPRGSHFAAVAEKQSFPGRSRGPPSGWCSPSSLPTSSSK